MTADAILFDLDGVLVDSRAAFANSVNAALTAHGLAERPAADLYRYLGPPLHGTFATLAPDADDAGVDGLVEAYRARYRSIGFGESALFAGIADVLVALGATMPLVVATSKPQALAAPLLEALGVAGRFRAIVGPSLDVRAEPKAITIGRALAHLGGARAPVMVGDRRYDVLGAAAHGLPCIGVLWGVGSAEELREAGAAALAEAPAVLPGLLGAV
jgi:phosphoglycolate phosphatase